MQHIEVYNHSAGNTVVIIIIQLNQQRMDEDDGFGDPSMDLERSEELKVIVEEIADLEKVNVLRKKELQDELQHSIEGVEKMRKKFSTVLKEQEDDIKLENFDVNKLKHHLGIEYGLAFIVLNKI